MTERVYEIDQERQRWDQGTGDGDYPCPFGDADGEGTGDMDALDEAETEVGDADTSVPNRRPLGAD